MHIYERIRLRIDLYYKVHLKDNPTKMYISCNLIHELMLYLAEYNPAFSVYSTDYIRNRKDFKMMYMGLDIVRIVEDDHLLIK